MGPMDTPSPTARRLELMRAPAVAAYLARTGDRRWFAYAAAGLVYAFAYEASPVGVLAVLAVLALPFLRGARQERGLAGGAARTP
jgi:hypothetical protein